MPLMWTTLALFLLAFSPDEITVRPDIVCLERNLGQSAKCSTLNPVDPYEKKSYIPFYVRCRSGQNGWNGESHNYCACLIAYGPHYRLRLSDLDQILLRGGPKNKIEYSLVNVVCPQVEKVLDKTEGE